MQEPKHKDYDGVESGLGLNHPLNHPLAQIAHDLRDGLRLLEERDPENSPTPLAGMRHEEDASYFWVLGTDGQKVRVKLERE